MLVLVVAAFAAGWIARGGDDAEAAAPEREAGGGAAPPVATPARATSARPDPARDAARALAFASAAYEKAVDRWLDERDEITPAGRAALGELERAVQRLDHAAARVDEVDEALGDAAFDAVEALRKGAAHLEAFREGRSLDAATSRELDRIEDEVARASEAFGDPPA